ncbi:MAG: 1,4-alpha-glucan branching protein GlgB [Propionicimonas sp.]
MHDPLGGLTGEDLAAFNRGDDTQCWRHLGSHVVTVQDDERGEVQGTRFAVWAPNARSVRLKVDVDGSTALEMIPVPGSGVWALFVEGVGEGATYRYDVLGADGVLRDKVDPMARFAETAPSNSSVVHESAYAWGDDEWMSARPATELHESPLAIYEVHLGSWRSGLTYVDLADQLVAYVTSMGYTHVEFMPITEHPLAASWGYQVTGYFAPQSRLGRPDELRHLVDRLHQAGIGVILDWVPGHFPKDDWALGRFDGTGLYEHPDWRVGEHREWGTFVFNFGRNEVRSFLTSSALFWVEEFHFDGLRVDAVASMVYLDYGRQPGEWVPNKHGGNHYEEAIDFLKYLNTQVYGQVPGVVMVAEESTAFDGVTRPISHGGLGFGFKWNMGWMNDTLRYLRLDPVHRQYQHHDMTFAMLYQYTENYILPISHDEIVHGKHSMINKIPQDAWRQFATLRAYYSFMWAFPGKKLLFMGCDFGQRPEWSEEVSLEWWVADHTGHRGLQRMIKDLNELYRTHPALWKLDSDPKGFQWINNHDAGGNTFAWLRFDGEGEQIACAFNFSPQPYTKHRMGLPETGTWVEIFNSDVSLYDGSGSFGNAVPITATADPCDGLPASATIVVPPLGAVLLKYEAAARPAPRRRIPRIGLRRRAEPDA